MGRPKKEIDEGILRRLAETCHSAKEIAEILDVSDTALVRFKDVIKEGNAKARINLRSQAFRLAMQQVKPSERMLEFLLKNFCGLSDKVEMKTTAEISGNVVYETEWSYGSKFNKPKKDDEKESGEPAT